MSIRVDAKGKIFTEIVRKDKVPVLIQTLTNVVHGYIFLRPEQRIRDALNESQELFIAVADAEVYAPNGQLLHRDEFLTVNKQHIVWIRPEPDPPQANQSQST